MNRSVGLVSLAAALALSACDTGNCDSSVLQSALTSASAGDVVEIGACRVEGRFQVPVGVTLRGRGPGATTLASSQTALELLGDATIEDLRIEHGGGHGIGVRGAGTVAIRNVAVASTRGRAGIGIADVTTSVILTDVTLEGPVADETAARALPEPPSATDTALFGIVLQDVATARFERVSANGYAAGGVVSSDSDLDWSGGGALHDVGIGVWIDGGSCTLTDVVVEDTLRGFRGFPSFGLVSGRDANVATTRLTIRATHDGLGLLHDTGMIVHDGLLAEGHEAGGVVVQSSTSFALRGASRIADNDLGGLLAVDAGGLSVDGARIERTRLVTRIFAGWPNVTIGDALQIASPRDGTTISNLVLDANERAGVLIDLAGADTSSVAFDNVSVDGAGGAYGVVAQGGTTLAGWDSGVARMGVTEVNDAAFTGGLDVIRPFGAMSLPATGDLAGVVTPCD